MKILGEVHGVPCKNTSCSRFHSDSPPHALVPVSAESSRREGKSASGHSGLRAFLRDAKGGCSPGRTIVAGRVELRELSSLRRQRELDVEKAGTGARRRGKSSEAEFSSQVPERSAIRQARNRDAARVRGRFRQGQGGASGGARAFPRLDRRSGPGPLRPQAGRS